MIRLAHLGDNEPGQGLRMLVKVLINAVTGHLKVHTNPLVR
jgi:hypothetical protein